MKAGTTFYTEKDNALLVKEMLTLKPTDGVIQMTRAELAKHLNNKVTTSKLVTDGKALRLATSLDLKLLSAVGANESGLSGAVTRLTQRVAELEASHKALLEMFRDLEAQCTKQ